MTKKENEKVGSYHRFINSVGQCTMYIDISTAIQGCGSVLRYTGTDG